ncbi:MAG: glycosyltransferase [Lachnospiraceae bacterium]|nr:glycosyltransferase [Lachnospiraceae bacterium]
MAKLDLRFYNNIDEYSDGDIENDILDIVKSGEDVFDSEQELPYPIIYHLSHLRENILNWYPFKKNASVLEIGSGCGAITGALCKKCTSVVSVELSKRRATINYERHKNYDNLQIMVGNLNDMRFDKKFDYIILNGVLEYACSFTEGDTPFVTFLNNISTHLKKDGILLISIENRLGLKYFSGAVEDHTNLLFLGLNDYSGVDSVRTFSKTEIIDVLNNAGFSNTEFYYPYPDYKFPNEIYTEASINEMGYGRPYHFFDNNRVEFFNNEKLYNTLRQEKIADKFANSFLIEASFVQNESGKKLYYVKSSNDRHPEYRINTIIYSDDKGEKYVSKIADSDLSYRHIQTIKRNETVCSEGYQNCRIVNEDKDYVEFNFINGRNLDEFLCEYARKHEIDKVWKIFEKYNTTFLSDANSVSIDGEDFVSVFGKEGTDKEYQCISPANIDLLLDNVFVVGDELTVIDYEWVFDFPIPVKFIAWRMINELYNKHTFLDEVLDRKKVFEFFSIENSDIDLFLNWTLHFIYEYVGGEQLRASYGAKSNISIQDIVDKDNKKNSIRSQLYLNKGTGYSEEESIRKELSLANDGKFEVRYNVNSFVESLRWDPTDLPCQCVDVRIIVDDNVVKYIDNSLLEGSKFLNNDPWYEVQGIDTYVGKVKITGTIEYISEEKSIEFLNKRIIMDNDEVKSLLSKYNESQIALKNITMENNNLVVAGNEMQRELQALHEYQGFVEQSTVWRCTKWHRADNWDKFIQKYKVQYNIDLFEYSNNQLIVKGWVLLPHENYEIVYRTGNYERALHVVRGIKRSDVSNAFGFETPYLGFWSEWAVANLKEGDIVLRYRNSGIEIEEKIGSCGESFKDEIKTYIEDAGESGIRKYIPSLRPSKVIDNLQKIRAAQDVAPSFWGSKIPDIRSVHSRYDKKADLRLPDELVVDIIVPVYNGYIFIKKLFASIFNTSVRMRLIIINDCSTDPNVVEFLESLSNEHENVVLINNDVNMGFVKSVNRGLKESTNHVVLVNTDVELPSNWLERLIAPIINDDTVASTTPFTNSGTICSFPNFCKDNKLFAGASVDLIDDVFCQLDSITYDVPTGVGFCMGMNKKAIKQVGLLDEDNFGKGYGEENDWCQRAIDAGYRNVHVCNLFVFHNHGGSFASEEKLRLISDHAKVMLDKHPNYNADVAAYVGRDPAGEIRAYALFELMMKINSKKVMYINHCLGGGANDYLINKRNQRLANNELVATLFYEHTIGVYRIQVNYQEYELSFFYVNDSVLKSELLKYRFDEVIINELVSYPDLFEIMNWIVDYCNTKKSKLIMLMHDYYSVCPGINLLDDSGAYCDVSHCQDCVVMQEFLNPINKTGRDWENNWKSFLNECDEVTVFSHDTERILEKRYGVLNNINYVPHVVDYMPVLDKKTKMTDTINIGILGAMSKHKGYDIVNALVKLFDKDDIQVKIIHFGNSDEGCQINSKKYVEYGRYRVGQLPNLVFKYDIDVFFIPSIWPETFSYTTQEIIKMNMPVAVLPIGAPAERVKDYERGLVLSSWDVETISKEILIFANNYKSNKITNKKVLFIREYQSFSSRYRVEHLAEQMLFAGIDYDYYDISEVDIDNISQYDALIVYRCRMSSELKSLVDKFKNAGKKTFYDTDDFIFNYDAIKNQDFLKLEEYADFDVYSGNMNKGMSLFNNFITSTEHLKNEIINSFPDSNVIVNRNIASCEMLIESLKACEISKHKDKLILGYFSGSRTHDNDFLLIEDVIIDVLRKYDNVYLMIVGCLQLGDKFSLLSERIIYHDFVEWQKLPMLIRSVDINLMPLVNDRFTICKSENKWMEAALVKVPTIASYNDELSACIKDGVDGLLCKNNQEWFDRLCKLIEDDIFRSGMGDNAYEKCIEEKTTINLPLSLI